MGLVIGTSFLERGLIQRNIWPTIQSIARDKASLLHHRLALVVVAIVRIVPNSFWFPLSISRLVVLVPTLSTKDDVAIQLNQLFQSKPFCDDEVIYRTITK